MTTLEARIAEVLAAHFASNSPRDHTPHCQCGWKGAAGLGLFDFDASHKEALAHQTAMLAPVIREAQAEAWDECVHIYDSMVCLDCEPKAPANPYRADNLTTP